MRTGYLITAKFRGLERPVSFHLIEEYAERKLAELLDARDLSNEEKDYLEILEELDSEIITWYNIIDDFSNVEYITEELNYE
jgi:hypothetical protein